MAKGKHRVGIKIDMTPMVDVAFLLLIFFMSTTQFKPPEEVSVSLPFSSSEIKVPEINTIILTVNKDGRVFIGGERGDAREVQKDSDGVLKAITDARTKRPGAYVVVKADKGANYGQMWEVMDALARSNTLRFNLMTELRTDRERGK